MRRILWACGLALLLAGAQPVAALTLSGPITVTTGCCATPRDDSLAFDPNAAAVEISGFVDLSGLAQGSAVLLGFVDAAHHDGGGSTFMGGAYVYVSRTGTGIRVAVSDGNLGGEIVQAFHNVAGETAVSFTALIGLGEIQLDWTAGAQSGSLSDSYGAIKTLNNAGAYAWDEFALGAYLAVDLFANAPLPGTVEFSVSTVPEPSTALLVLAGLAALARRRRGR